MGNPWNIKPYNKADGSTTYNLRVRRKGHLHTETFLTHKAAQRAGIKITAQMDDGTFISKKDRAASSTNMTFSEALDKLLTIPYFMNLKGYGVERDRARKMKTYSFAKIPIENIKTSDLAAFRDERMKEKNKNTGKPLAAQTIRNDFTLIKYVYKFAISEWGFGHIDNVSKKIILPKPSKGRIKRLENGEMEAILEMARKETGRKWLAPFIEFSVETGMRLSEICKIEVQHLDMNKEMIFLMNTKNGESRDIPVPPRAWAALIAYKPLWGKKTLFGVKPITVQKAWADIKKKLKANDEIQDDWHFHDFRHEACSRFVEWYGIGIPQIQLISGHKDWNTLRRYVNLKPDHVAASFKNIDFSEPISV